MKKKTVIFIILILLVLVAIIALIKTPHNVSPSSQKNPTTPTQTGKPGVERLSFLPKRKAIYTYYDYNLEGKYTVDRIQYVIVNKNIAIYVDQFAQGGYENAVYQTPNGVYQNGFIVKPGKKTLSLIKEEEKQKGELIFKIPIQTGDTWSVGKTIGKGKLSVFTGTQYTLISKNRTITTGSYTFTNVVEIEEASSSGTVSKYYYAPNIGLVESKTPYGTSYLEKIQKS